MEERFKRNIAIVGLGLIGGSYAMALRRFGADKIYGIDRDDNVLKKALECGVIDIGHREAEEILGMVDMVIIALYPMDTIEFIIRNAEYFKPGTIVTDTCGIKQPIIDAAKKYLPEGVEFIGGHPMAGNEFQGFEAASPELFHDTNYILTPHQGCSGAAIAAVGSLAAAIGCRRVTKLKAEQHDRTIALTSQLPHIVAVSIANLAADESGMDAFVGRSIRDVTRVAALNKELWKQIFSMNGKNVVERIEAMEAILGHLKKAIAVQDEYSLGILFGNAVKGKSEIDR